MRREERYGGRGMGRLVDTYDVKVERQIWEVEWGEIGRGWRGTQGRSSSLNINLEKTRDETMENPRQSIRV